MLDFGDLNEVPDHVALVMFRRQILKHFKCKSIRRAVLIHWEHDLAAPIHDRYFAIFQRAGVFREASAAILLSFAITSLFPVKTPPM